MALASQVKLRCHLVHIEKTLGAIEASLSMTKRPWELPKNFRRLARWNFHALPPSGSAVTAAGDCREGHVYWAHLTFDI